MKIAISALLTVILAGCAIEGVGWQGHVDAYNNAAAAGGEYVALNRGTRDAGWYAGWCATIEPHFKLMSDVHDRVERYCAAMQAQPQNAEAIQRDLATMLTEGSVSATGSRNAAYSAFGASNAIPRAPTGTAQTQYVPMQTKSPVHCTSTTLGNFVNTDCQ
jgi:hypothetical protein